MCMCVVERGSLVVVVVVCLGQREDSVAQLLVSAVAVDQLLGSDGRNLLSSRGDIILLQ